MDKVSLEYINTRDERMVVIAEKQPCTAIQKRVGSIYRVRSKKGSNESLSVWFDERGNGELTHFVQVKMGKPRNMYVGKAMRTVPVDESVPMTLPQRVAFTDPDKTIVR
jgi:hypothetical protein